MFLVKCALYSSLFLSFEITVGGVIKHEVIDNTVSKFGDDFVLTRRSEIYGISYNLVLTKEDDPLIFDEEDSSIFVIILPSSENKAFGTIKDEHFFGQFRVGNINFYNDHPEKVGKTGQAILYSAEDVLDQGNQRGKFLTPKFKQKVPQPLVSREKTQGNIFRMRIIVDKFLLKTFGNDRSRVKAMVKEHEMSLNEIYQVIEIRGRPFQFKVVDIEFHDEAYCPRNRNSVGARSGTMGGRQVLGGAEITLMFVSHFSSPLMTLAPPWGSPILELCAAPTDQPLFLMVRQPS